MKFNYEKWTAKNVYAQGVEVEDQIFYGQSSTSGNTYFSFSKESGTYSLTGPVTTLQNTGSSFWSDSVFSYTNSGSILFRYAFKSNALYRYKRDSFFNGYEEDTFLGKIIAEDGTYPSKGKHTDGFFYIRTTLSDKPTLVQPNGGETASSMYPINWTVGAVGMSYEVELSTNNGSTWKNIATTAINVTTYTHNFYNEPETSIARVRIRGKSGSNYTEWVTSAGVFSNLYNVPPNQPSLISPVGEPVDRANVVRITWKHNDPNSNDRQTKAILNWKVKNATTWNTINITGTNEYYDASANVFPEGEILWRVKTYDQLGYESPYSNEGLFLAAYASNAPVITNPVGNIVPLARPTIQWTATDQVAYQVVISNSLGVVVWDSGVITSQNKAQTVAVDLINGGLYVLKVRIKNTNDLWSSEAIKNITVSYTPPAIPNVSADDISSGIRIIILHKAPVETEPNVIKTDIFRRTEESNWIRIGENISGAYQDITAASHQIYQYQVRTFGDNGTFSDSAVIDASTILKGVWLHDPLYPDQIHQFKLGGKGRSENYTPDGTLMKYAGRRLAVAEYDEHESHSVTTTINLLNREDLIKLTALIRSRQTLCFRDNRGRKLFCHCFNLPIVDEFYGNSVSLTFDEVSYDEEV